MNSGHRGTGVSLRLKRRIEVETLRSAFCFLLFLLFATKPNHELEKKLPLDLRPGVGALPVSLSLDPSITSESETRS